MPSTLKIGIDFGTTNSSVAITHPTGTVELVRFPTASAATESFRSVLYLEQQKGRVASSTGPQAIEHYLAAEMPGRLIQSLKSYLPSRTLTGTEVFGRRYTLEDLIARILTDLRLGLEKHLGGAIPADATVTVGRPVRFVSAENDEDDAYATERLRAAFAQAGFPSVTFELEPIAAAFAYEASLDRDETILIGDFGGGTSDFSLLPVGPSLRGARQVVGNRIIGNSGLGLAGDAFDARIVRKLVSPALGADTLEKTYDNPFAPPVPKRFPGRAAVLPPRRELKIIPAVPAWIYANLERWHYLSFLKTRNVTEILKAARARAEEPEKVASLITLIEEDLGYQLHQAVQRLKIDLSHRERAEFRFPELDPTGSRGMRTEVGRADFEGWIAAELDSIETCVDGLLASTATSATMVDRVFLTGGTSFVPAVRRIFEERFGAAKVVTGNEFTSVARGLALRSA
jgi:hypothetical chaperone protein